MTSWPRLTSLPASVCPTVPVPSTPYFTGASLCVAAGEDVLGLLERSAVRVRQAFGDPPDIAVEFADRGVQLGDLPLELLHRLVQMRLVALERGKHLLHPLKSLRHAPLETVDRGQHLAERLCLAAYALDDGEHLRHQLGALVHALDQLANAHDLLAH